MTVLKRGMVVDVDLDPRRGSETGQVRPCVIVTNDVYNARVPVIQVVPVTEWSERTARIVTNITLAPTPANGLTKPSIADCLQTRPIDRNVRLKRIRGQLEAGTLARIDDALVIVFGLRLKAVSVR